MKTSLLAILAVFSTFFIIGCLESMAIYDCGNDIQCLADHLQNCSLAKVTIDEYVGGVQTKGYMEIKGPGENAGGRYCTVYSRQDQGTLNLTRNALIAVIKIYHLTAEIKLKIV